MNRKLIAVLLVSGALLTSCIRQTMTAQERQVFMPISVLADYGADLPEKYGECEKYSKTMYYDSTFELEYEFDPPEDVQSDVRYLSETYSFETRRSNVLVGDLVGKGITSAVFQSQGAKLVPQEDAFSWGESSTADDIVAKNGAVVGNRFVASSDKMTFTMTIVGMHIGNKDVWAELLLEKLERAKKFSIDFYRLQAE